MWEEASRNQTICLQCLVTAVSHLTENTCIGQEARTSPSWCHRTDQPGLLFPEWMDLWCICFQNIPVTTSRGPCAYLSTLGSSEPQDSVS